MFLNKAGNVKNSRLFFTGETMRYKQLNKSFFSRPDWVSLNPNDRAVYLQSIVVADDYGFAILRQLFVLAVPEHDQGLTFNLFSDSLRNLINSGFIYEFEYNKQKTLYFTHHNYFCNDYNHRNASNSVFLAGLKKDSQEYNESFQAMQNVIQTALSVKNFKRIETTENKDNGLDDVKYEFTAMSDVVGDLLKDMGSKNYPEVNGFSREQTDLYYQVFDVCDLIKPKDFAKAMIPVNGNSQHVLNVLETVKSKKFENNEHKKGYILKAIKNVSGVKHAK